MSSKVNKVGQGTTNRRTYRKEEPGFTDLVKRELAGVASDWRPVAKGAYSYTKTVVFLPVTFFRGVMNLLDKLATRRENHNVTPPKKRQEQAPTPKSIATVVTKDGDVSSSSHTKRKRRHTVESSFSLEVREMAAQEIANIFLPFTSSHPRYVRAFLEDVRDGCPVNEALSRNCNGVQRKNIVEILRNVIFQKTDSETADRVIDFLFNDHIEPIVEVVEEPEPASATIPIPREQPYTINEKMAQSISTNSSALGLNENTVNEFLGLDNERTFSSHSIEELNVRVAFLQTLAEIKILKRLNNPQFSLEDEYNAYRNYMKADEQIRKETLELLNYAHSWEFNAYSTRANIAKLLSKFPVTKTYNKDAKELVLGFTRRAIVMSSHGTRNALAFFNRALDKNPEEIKALEIKLEVANHLHKKYRNNFSFSPNPPEDKYDFEVSDGNTVYLVYAFNVLDENERIDDVSSFAGRTWMDFERKRNRNVIPACATYGAIEVLGRTKPFKNKHIEQFQRLKDLFDIKNDIDEFEVWDMHGNNLRDRFNRVAPSLLIALAS